MIQPITAILSLSSTVMLAVLIVFLYKFKRGIPDFKQIFDDLGLNISKVFQESFEKPSVSKAMSVLGSKSGEVRADKALQKRVAAQAIDKIPGIGLILKQFDLTPIEGLKLMNDPVIGPLIQRGLAMAQGAISKATQGGGGQQNSSSGKVGYG